MARHAAKGIIVSASGFTAAAMDLAAKNSIGLYSIKEILSAESKNDILKPRSSNYQWVL